MCVLSGHSIELIEAFNYSIFNVGDNYQESDSPSWFNPQEALQTIGYYRQLLKVGVDPVDVGIISPYRKQVWPMNVLSVWQLWQK